MNGTSPFGRSILAATMSLGLTLAFDEAHAQVYVPRGVHVFSDLAFNGTSRHYEVIGGTNNPGFVIRSVKIWPGYKATLGNAQGDEVELTASHTNLNPNQAFVRVEIATDLANPRGTHFGYAEGTRNAIYHRYYLRAGINTVPEAETGGPIQTVETDKEYSYRRPSEWTVELFCNPTTTVYRRTNFEGRNGELVAGATYTPSSTGRTRELPVTRFRSMKLECGKRATITVSGVGPGVNVRQTFDESIEDLSAAFANLPARQPVERYIQRVRIHN